MRKQKPKKAKLKVKDLAQELKLEPKELLATLKDLNIKAKTSASAIDEESAKIVRELLEKEKEKEQEKEEEREEFKPIPESKAIIIDTPVITVKDLAFKFKVKPADLIKELMKKGILANINQPIDAKMVPTLAQAFGLEVEIKEKAGEKEKAKAKVKEGAPRPPIITVMGHVDHGKTKLLDAIRKTDVIATEAGGITQHIGAYQVEVHGRKVTFLDTPGHEAFTALRARGAKVTDIAVLVVAADDGVKPQTIEAIDHAKAARVPIIVAINKIDKPEANIDRTKTQLSELGLQAEDWGGQTVTVPISAKQNQGINDLLDMILLVADMQELKANAKESARGVVVESKLDKGRGAVATVLIQNGTLEVGDCFVIGNIQGKVRALITDKGKRVNSAGPATPIEILGISEVPLPGETLEVVKNEKEARALAQERKAAQEQRFIGRKLSLEDFSQEIKKGAKKDLPLIIKTDVQGSLEAIKDSIKDLTVQGIKTNIIHGAVGAINTSDIILAKATGAIIVGFHVGFEEGAKVLAENEGVGAKIYDIIYKLTEDIKLALKGLLEPEYEEAVIGHAEVRNIFKYSKIGVIAGCFIIDGKVVRGGKIRIFRGKEKIHEGKLESLKRFKEDVREVETNFECGIAIQGYTNFKTGDIIEAFEMREKPPPEADKREIKA